MIKDWRKLKPGMHIRLSCGCAGFVLHTKHEPSENDCDTGFYMMYTAGLSCKGPNSLEKTYRDGYGPYCNYFNYDLKEDAMPAEEEEIPVWWEEVRHHERFAISRY